MRACFKKKTEKNEREELAQQEEENTISHRFDMEPRPGTSKAAVFTDNFLEELFLPSKRLL